MPFLLQQYRSLTIDLPVACLEIRQRCRGYKMNNTHDLALYISTLWSGIACKQSLSTVVFCAADTKQGFQSKTSKPRFPSISTLLRSFWLCLAMEKAGIGRKMWLNYLYALYFLSLPSRRKTLFDFLLKNSLIVSVQQGTKITWKKVL